MNIILSGWLNHQMAARTAIHIPLRMSHPAYLFVFDSIQHVYTKQNKIKNIYGIYDFIGQVIIHNIT